MVLGNVIIYAVGVSWLYHESKLSAGQAVHYGMTVFLISDALKIVVAALALPGAWRLVRRG
jgi:biotin transport system substrate-specific component